VFIILAIFTLVGLFIISSIQTENFYRQTVVILIFISIFVSLVYFAPLMDEKQKTELELLQQSLIERGLATFTPVIIEKQKKFELLPTAEKELQNENK